MLHLGDITKISGYTVPIVDCIIGGSPCQDLSVAGKRAGLDGERSGLYMEQIRIVKEMREQDERNGRTDDSIRPRYMVWENVPGAFSSNKGEDFRIVLEELAKVKDKDAVIPMPDKGKWTTCGSIMGDGWSIAWRVLDAQFWGVPQRRRRIALVADFGGQSASEILFVRKSLSGHTDKSKPKRKETASDASGGIGADDKCRVSSVISIDRESINSGSGFNRTPGIGEDGISPTLKSTGPDSVAYQEAICFAAHGFGNYEHMNAVGSLMCGQNQTVRGDTPLVVALDRASYNQGKNAQYDFEVSEKGINSPLVAKGPGAVCYSVDQGGGKSSVDIREGKDPTLTTTHDGAPAVCYWDGGQVTGTLTANNAGGNQRMPDKENFNCVIASVDCRNGTENEVNGALQSNSAHSLNGNNVVRCRYIVRRLTPLECERLQGYPDGWTDIGDWTDSNGKVHKTSDAARYKALGNSIALPPWKWVLKRLCACYERDATMASLFDGIGGFPYLWEQLNGKGTCLWASEIEEFPIAVTKVRIGE